MESRARQRNTSDTRLMSVMKGAEKRALDFYNDAMSSTKKVVQSSNSVSGSNLTKGESQAYRTVAMLKSGALSPVKASQHAVETSFTNGGDPKTFKNVVGVGSIGVSLIASAALACHNAEAIKQINSDEPVLTTNKQGESIQVLNIKELTETHNLLKERNIIPENLDFNLKNIKDIKTLKANMDVYGRREFGREVFSLSNDELKKMIERFSTQGNTEAVTVLKTALSIKNLSDTPQFNLFESRSLKYKVSKLARTNMPKDDYVAAGYQRLINTKFQIKMSMKVAKYSVKMNYKLYGHLVQGTQQLMGAIANKAQATGHMKVAGTLNEINGGIDNARNTLKTATNKVKQVQRDISSSYKDMKTLVPQEIKSKVFSGNARKASKAVTGAEKTAKKTAGRTSKAVGKKVAKKTIKKTTTKAAKKITLETVKQVAIHTISEVVQWLTGIKEIVIAIVVALLLAAIITEIPLVMVSSVTAIGDAVSKTFEDFKEKTSMGAAYTKLIEKEEKFSASLQALSTTEKPPDTVTGQYSDSNGGTSTCNIPVYTKTTINYYDGDGNTPTNTQTIKGILAMAAIYIDQDFAKYGAFLEGVGLTDSVYKDYCAQLYDSTHLIGIDSSSNNIYYCADPDNADATCNNKKSVNHGSGDGDPPDYCDNAYTWETGNDEDGYEDHWRCEGHNRCGGHVDLNAHVVISNISYPQTDDNITTVVDYEADDSGSESGDGEKLDVGEAKPETAYSMYILDKYATAFNKSSDYESATNADGTEEFSAEMEILKTVTGQDIIKRVDWAESTNNWWASNVATERAYFRLKNNGDINDPEDPVSVNNSTPYYFKSFTSSNKRNKKFEEHGWDEDSISLVRLLLTADWEELYGIKDFGIGIAGTPLSESQIAALISSNPNWSDLSPARKAIMAQCMQLDHGINYDRKGFPYFWGGHAYGKGISGVNPNGMDCSGFVAWVYWSVFDMSDFPDTTSRINSELPRNPQFTKEIYTSSSQLEPGDIVLKRDGGSTEGSTNHVLIYAGKDPDTGADMFFHESGKNNGYQYSTYNSLIRGTSIIYKLKNIDSMEINYGYGTGSYTGAMDVNLNASQKEVALSIAGVLESRGYSTAAIAGALGNIQQECSFDPNCGNSGSKGAYGLIQWMDGRKTALKALANSNGVSYSDIGIQLKFMCIELDDGYEKRMDNYCKEYFGAKFKDLTNPEDAAEAWAVIYEGCIGGTSSDGSSKAKNGKMYQQLTTRKQYANSFFNGMN